MQIIVSYASLAMKFIYHKERRLSMGALKPEDEL